MDRQNFNDLCKQVFSQNHLSDYSTKENLERFYLLSELMLETNQTMNLTALKDETALIARHLADCLLAADKLPQKKDLTLLDVGSGGGMPALPFAIVRPDIEVTALDAPAKKTAYIAHAASELGLKNVHILNGRAEELGTDLRYREKFDIVCARAVAELRILLEWCVPFVKTGGFFLALKGKNGLIELESAKNAAAMLFCSLEADENVCLVEQVNGDTTTNERHIFLFKKTRPTEKIYPRRNAIITKKPL